MYCTMPSGTRYQIGWRPVTRSRQSVDEMASAGTSINVIRSGGKFGDGRRIQLDPGPRTADEVGQFEQFRTSRQVRIWASASAPVMKNRSTSSPRSARRSRSVSTV